MIRFCDSNGTNRANVKETVRDILPGQTSVFRLPHATTGRSHVIQLRIIRHASYRRDTAASKRSYQAPLIGRKQLQINCICRKTSRDTD